MHGWHAAQRKLRRPTCSCISTSSRRCTGLNDLQQAVGMACMLASRAREQHGSQMPQMHHCRPRLPAAAQLASWPTAGLGRPGCGQARQTASPLPQGRVALAGGAERSAATASRCRRRGHKTGPGAAATAGSLAGQRAAYRWPITLQGRHRQPSRRCEAWRRKQGGRRANAEPVRIGGQLRLVCALPCGHQQGQRPFGCDCGPAWAHFVGAHRLWLTCAASM